MAEMAQELPEQIGEGRFDKMVRLALSDPDGEIWRYSIKVSGKRIVGRAIWDFAIVAP
jgi:hypothetical protein